MEFLISQEDQIIFEKYQSLYDTIKSSGFVRNYTIQAYKDMIYLYTKYITASHSYTHWCGDCRLQLVKHLYTWYEKQLLDNADRVIKEIVEAVGENENVEPVKKKRGRKPKSQS
jgi:hypothetical protein